MIVSPPPTTCDRLECSDRAVGVDVGLGYKIDSVGVDVGLGYKIDSGTDKQTVDTIQ